MFTVYILNVKVTTIVCSPPRRIRPWRNRRSVRRTAIGRKPRLKLPNDGRLLLRKTDLERTFDHQQNVRPVHSRVFIYFIECAVDVRIVPRVYSIHESPNLETSVPERQQEGRVFLASEQPVSFAIDVLLRGEDEHPHQIRIDHECARFSSARTRAARPEILVH